MPCIRAIEKLVDGFRITRSNGQVITITSANIPANATLASAQAWIDNWLLGQGLFGDCRVRNLAPLDLDLMLSDKGALPPNAFTRPM